MGKDKVVNWLREQATTVTIGSDKVVNWLLEHLVTVAIGSDKVVNWLSEQTTTVAVGSDKVVNRLREQSIATAIGRDNIVIWLLEQFNLPLKSTGKLSGNSVKFKYEMFSTEVLSEANQCATLKRACSIIEFE